MYLIDRRKNPSGKSLSNTQRFSYRAKAAIKRFVDDSVKEHSLGDVTEKNSIISVRKSSETHEPTFHFTSNFGDMSWVLPGNPNKSPDDIMAYEVGDLVPKPEGGARGAGREGSPDGDGEDAFQFAISSEEYLKILFEDCELPNAQRKQTSVVETTAWNKKGFKTTGSPANISARRTLRNSFGRRMALDRPKYDDILELEEKLFDENISDEEREIIKNVLLRYQEKLKAIPYIDPIDVRYHNLEQQPKPIFNAVMFAVMDVSGSMTEHMKDLAKRFYILLYRFLKRKYPKVEVVFIRHTHVANIVDEYTFFHDLSTGGTLVSPALDLVKKEVKNRFDPKLYDVYIAQVSDGDNYSQDNVFVLKAIKELMPSLAYHFYLEVGRDLENFPSGMTKRESDLWTLYVDIQKEYPSKFAMKQAEKRKDIYPVFREFFAKKDGK